MKIIVNKKNFKEQSLSEIYSSAEEIPCIALLNPNYEKITSFIKCKDYIQDTLYCQDFYNNFNFPIYGYSYKYIKDIKFKDLKFLFKYNNIEEYRNLNDEDRLKKIEEWKIQLQFFINSIENHFNFKNSNFEIVIYDTNYCILMEQSEDWSKKLYLMSLYMILCRIGILYKNENNSINDILDYIRSFDKWDRSNIKNALKNIDLVFDKLSKNIILDEIIKDNTKSYIHENTGIVNCQLVERKIKKEIA